MAARLGRCARLFAPTIAMMFSAHGRRRARTPARERRRRVRPLPCAAISAWSPANAAIARPSARRCGTSATRPSPCRWPASRYPDSRWACTRRTTCARGPRHAHPEHRSTIRRWCGWPRPTSCAARAFPPTGRSWSRATARFAFHPAPKIPLNRSYYDASSVAFFRQRTMTVRGTPTADGFVARTFWPEDFRVGGAAPRAAHDAGRTAARRSVAQPDARGAARRRAKSLRRVDAVAEGRHAGATGRAVRCWR